MKKDLNNELLLVALQCSDFTYQVLCFGLQELLKFILTTPNIPEDFDCEEFIADVKLLLDEPITVGNYGVFVPVATNFSKSQILNYFEHE